MGEIMNKKIILISLTIFLLIIGFQYSIVLNEQKAPPSVDWSRSFTANASIGNYSKLYSVPTENGYTISLLDFEEMNILSCSEDILCSHIQTITELDPYKNIWSDGDTTYYIKPDDTFVRFTSGEETEISRDVEDFAKSGDTLVYWLTNQQVVIQQRDNEPVIHTPRYPVEEVMIENGHIFIVTLNLQENIYAVLDGTNSLTELFHFGLIPPESMSAMYISTEREGEYRLLIDTVKNSGGSVVKKIRSASFELSANQIPELTELTFVDQDTGVALYDVRNPSFFRGESGIHITFTANTNDPTGKKVNKVFTGNFDGLDIEAIAVTKNGDYYVRPLHINEQTIAYYKLSGNKKELMYSSTTDEKVAQSSKVQKGDIKEAFLTFFSLLFNGLVLILLSFAWLIPALFIGYLTLALLQKTWNPHAHTIAVFVNAVALVFTQIVMFIVLFNPERILLRAPYLTEVWHVSTVSVIAGILCILPVLLTRTKVTEDNFNKYLLFTTGLNLLIMVILIGPYFV